MSKIGPYNWGHIAFVTFMICLVLEEYEFVGLVIGGVIGRVGHK